MRRMIAKIAFLTAGICMFAGCASTQPLRPEEFASPAPEYRPVITIEEGSGYQAPLDESARRAMDDLAAGGLMISPQPDPERKKSLNMSALATTPLGLQDEYPASASPWLPKALPGEARFGSYFADGRAGPGPGPELGYMTPEWFSEMRAILEAAKAKGRFAVYYDEAGFPSGSANYTLPPQFNRKLLQREEVTLSPGQAYVWKSAERQSLPLAVVALDTASGQRVDLLSQSEGGLIKWTAPKGNWRVQEFYLVTSQARAHSPDYYGAADYLDAEATRWFIDQAYARAHEGLSEYFGSTIRFTFFDDVGIYSEEKTWHASIASRFEALTGRPAAAYYPALWEDIGAETAPARIGFYKARAEILGETFPKLITDWAHAHGVQSTGHAPGNFALQPTDMLGDPFKFYAYTDIPMADVLWGLGHARDGFKLISSVSAQRGLPMTAAEAFSVTYDANGYRRMIELFVRGFNMFITGARVPSDPVGTPEELANWAGRSSYLLRGGSQVADVAVLFPIESLQAFYAFNDPANSADLPAGVHVYRDADYQAVGEMLMSDLHRDFTFVHPDAVGSEQFQVEGSRLVMKNEGKDQFFRVLVLPGGEVLSVEALSKVRSFYEHGGTVIATSLLPSRSAEFGRDDEIRAMIAEMFGDSGQIRKHASGGQAVFLRQPSAAALDRLFNDLGIPADVAFNPNLAPVSGNGVFGYTHRKKDGLDVYYFGNSSDTDVKTEVSLRGAFRKVELWNPHDGSVTQIRDVRRLTIGAETYSVFALDIPKVSSRAVVAR